MGAGRQSGLRHTIARALEWPGAIDHGERRERGQGFGMVPVNHGELHAAQVFGDSLQRAASARCQDQLHLRPGGQLAGQAFAEHPGRPDEDDAGLQRSNTKRARSAGDGVMQVLRRPSRR